MRKRPTLKNDSRKTNKVLYFASCACSTTVRVRLRHFKLSSVWLTLQLNMRIRIGVNLTFVELLSSKYGVTVLDIDVQSGIFYSMTGSLACYFFLILIIARQLKSYCAIYISVSVDQDVIDTWMLTKIYEEAIGVNKK